MYVLHLHGTCDTCAERREIAGGSGGRSCGGVGGGDVHSFYLPIRAVGGKEKKKTRPRRNNTPMTHTRRCRHERGNKDERASRRDGRVERKKKVIKTNV